MATLYQNVHFVVQHHRASEFIQVIRTEAPFTSIQEAVSALTACRMALTGLDASRYGILLDWRRGPMSTDPNMHKALVGHTDALAKPFARRAVLVRTVVGAMQANRVGRNLSDDAANVFSDPEAALAYVRN